jgi:Tol biopolymer transport system component
MKVALFIIAALFTLLATASCDRDGCAVGLQQEARGIPWERLSGQIAYSRWDTTDPGETYGCLFMIDVPARKLRILREARITLVAGDAPAGWVRDLAFRKDGSTLTFAVLGGADDQWELHDLSLASGKEALLFPADHAHHNYPSWSPNGQLAYYSNGADGAYEAVDGRFMLSSDPGRVAWTAAGALIVTLPDSSSPGALYLADPATQVITGVVTSTGQEIFDQPALSPDGARLGYIRRGTGVRGEELWIADADGQHRRQLTGGGNADFEPAWSADGQQLLFSRFNQGLFLYDLASGSLVRVTQQRADSMAWSP